MKNTILALITVCVIVLGSCKKDSNTKNNNTNNTVPGDGWKLGSTSYKEVIGARIPGDSGTGPELAVVAFDAIPSGSSSSANTFIATFKVAPTTNGTYHVVEFPGSTALTTSQVGITAAGPGGSYTSTGSGSVDVTVTVTGGKVKVSVPSVQVKKTTSADVLNVTGTITEN